MGGRGSGSWYRWNTKETTESRHRVDISFLHKQGYLQPGVSGTLSWSRCGEKTGVIRFRSEVDRVTLSYNIQLNGGEWESIEEKIHFDKTRCNYGGSRFWFLCPHCSKRAAFLYGAGKRFLCRDCYGLTYATQQENQPDRLLRKARSIREKLGGDGSLMGPFPWKPKRMHWQTYWRLRKEAEALESMGWTNALQRLGIEL